MRCVCVCVNVTDTLIGARLYSFKMKLNKKSFDFCERFNSIIREYENCETAVPRTEQEKRLAFY